MEHGLISSFKLLITERECLNVKTEHVFLKSEFQTSDLLSDFYLGKLNLFFRLFQYFSFLKSTTPTILQLNWESLENSRIIEKSRTLWRKCDKIFGVVNWWLLPRQYCALLQMWFSPSMENDSCCWTELDSSTNSISNANCVRACCVVKLDRFSRISIESLRKKER